METPSKASFHLIFSEEGLSSSFQDAQIIFSEENNIFQIWTSDTIFLYDWSEKKQRLSLSTKLATDRKTNIQNWQNHQIKEGFLYLLLKDDPTKVLKLEINQHGISDVVQNQYEILDSPSNQIKDFFVSDSFVHLLEEGQGLSIYPLDNDNGIQNPIVFILDPLAQRVFARDNIVFIVREVQSSSSEAHFETIEYIQDESDQRNYICNSKKTFVGKFTGTLKIDQTRVLLLNENVLFIWYHSIPTRLQGQETDHIKSFVFYGHSNFLEQELSSLNLNLIFAQRQKQMQIYELGDTNPQIRCNLSTFPQSRLLYNLAYYSSFCPLKIQHNDLGLDSLCVYRQEIQINISSESSENRDKGLLNAIFVLSGVLLSMILILAYYLLKFRKSNSFFRDSVKTLRNKSQTIQMKGKNPYQLVQEIATDLERIVILTADDEISQSLTLKPCSEGEEEQNKNKNITGIGEDMRSTVLPIKSSEGFEDFIFNLKDSTIELHQSITERGPQNCQSFAE